MASALKERKACITIQRMGLAIQIESVPAEDASSVAAELLDEMRLLVEVFPELSEYPDVVPGGHPVTYNDDDYADESRGRIGFRAPSQAGRKRAV